MRAGVMRRLFLFLYDKYVFCKRFDNHNGIDRLIRLNENNSLTKDH